MAGWHHRLHGHGFEQTLGAGDGQGGLEYCSPWGHKEGTYPLRVGLPTFKEVQHPSLWITNVFARTGVEMGLQRRKGSCVL